MAKKVKNTLSCKNTALKTRLQKLVPYIKPFLFSVTVAFISYLGILAYEFSQDYRIVIKHVNETIESPVKEPLLKNLTPQPEDSPSQVKDEDKKSQYYQRLKRRPKYWFYMARSYMWIFFSVDNVLQRLGLEKIDVEVKHGKMVHNEWDLLWSYDYHNEIPLDFKNIDYNQRINHIPGNFVLTMKDFFALNTDSKYVPKAFNDSAKIKEYSTAHPEKKFLQKLWSNRGISMKNAEEISFEVFGPGYKYFAQEYVENPLLIDGYKFDFGIYVLISSVDPLRIYIYEKNILIRLCEDRYVPNNYTNVNTYVISDACKFPWDIDALTVYYNESYTYKESMNAYLTKNGYNVNRIWTQVDDCIREIVLSKEEHFKYWVMWKCILCAF
jgi:tubulin monoglycylase TTLL15